MAQPPRSPARPDSGSASLTPMPPLLPADLNSQMPEGCWGPCRAALGVCAVTCINRVAVKLFGLEENKILASAGASGPQSAEKDWKCLELITGLSQNLYPTPLPLGGCRGHCDGSPAQAAARMLDRRNMEGTGLGRGQSVAGLRPVGQDWVPTHRRSEPLWELWTCFPLLRLSPSEHGFSDQLFKSKWPFSPHSL